MAVSRRLRFEILRRDGHTCRYCGAKAPEVQLEVDHVIAVTLGGSDEPTNLVTSCEDCNSGKSSVPLDASTVDDIEQDALRWARAIERASEYRDIERYTMDDLIYAWGEEWRSWKTSSQETVPLDSEWEKSIEIFMNNGLSTLELSHLIDVTMRSRAVPSQKWKFFADVAGEASLICRKQRDN